MHYKVYRKSLNNNELMMGQLGVSGAVLVFGIGAISREREK
jgi:hypothetical protein